MSRRRLVLRGHAATQSVPTRVHLSGIEPSSDVGRASLTRDDHPEVSRRIASPPWESRRWMAGCLVCAAPSVCLRQNDRLGGALRGTAAVRKRSIDRPGPGHSEPESKYEPRGAHHDCASDQETISVPPFLGALRSIRRRQAAGRQHLDHVARRDPAFGDPLVLLAISEDDESSNAEKKRHDRESYSQPMSSGERRRRRTQSTANFRRPAGTTVTRANSRMRLRLTASRRPEFGAKPIASEGLILGRVRYAL